METENAEMQAFEKQETGKNRGLIIVHTGDGKGKTTAALGMMLRAWGRGMKVCMVQFIKSEKSRFGEHRAAEKIGIEIIRSGDGFVWESKDLDKTRAHAIHGWEVARQKIASGDYDMVVLDEMTYCFTFGWIDFAEVKAWLLENRPETTHVVFTGRQASQDLIDFADLVTEMKEIKHPFNTQGIKAQAGVEF